MAARKKILIIGGGFSGIGCIKSLKEEGHIPICYEKTSNFGGTWHYRDNSPIGVPSIMTSTIINHSKEMGAISDFPPDKKYPNYMRHHELLQYFKEVGERFDVFKHITFNREVIGLKRSPDYEETGRWSASIQNTDTGEITQETFDGVVVGVGQFSYPKMPEYPGMNKYKGIIMHTHEMKNADLFKNKKVVVVGVGCSGLDAAVEVSNCSQQVYLSTRSGTWVLPRLGVYGLPFDYTSIRRFINAIQNIAGYKFVNWYLEKYQLDAKFNHTLYKLRPPHRALEKDPVTNDILPAKLISGSVVIRKDIKYFTETGVVFEGETQVTEVDAVIMATGYKWDFSFLEDGIVTTENGRINLYKCMYPPHLKHPTLVIVGFILPFGPGFPLGEMQCRYAAQVYSGKLKLPSQEVMMKNIIERYEENAKRYVPSEKTSIRVEYIPYLDELAQDIGVKPNLWKYLFTDFTLFKALLFGASLPYQYRLQGPHKWEGARKAILTVHERVRYPLYGIYKRKPKGKLSTSYYVKYFILLLLLALYFKNSGESVKAYATVMMISYLTTWRGFYKKYFLSLLLMPFCITWDHFVLSYFTTLFIPIILATFSYI